MCDYVRLEEDGRFCADEGLGQGMEELLGGSDDDNYQIGGRANGNHPATRSCLKHRACMYGPSLHRLIPVSTSSPLGKSFYVVCVLMMRARTDSSDCLNPVCNALILTIHALKACCAKCLRSSVTLITR